MADKFDRIVLAVPELPVAVEQYRLLLGRAPGFPATPDESTSAWWGLSNTVVELVQTEVPSARVQGIVLSSRTAVQHDMPVANSLGIDVRLCDGSATEDFYRRQPEAQCPGLSIDHVVLRTDDADTCVELFSRTLDIRLALDKTVPAWGGRMLFFRAGKLTLEVIASTTDNASGGTAFWGLAYQCPDLEGFAHALTELGISVSPIRDGRKPGTRVATVKSHCLGIPTLLIQPATE